MEKIDIHCHTTTRASPDLPSAEISTIDGLMHKHDVVSTVLLATYFPHRGTGVSNYRLRNWIDHAPVNTSSIHTGYVPKRFVMFGSLDMEHYFLQGLNELEEMAEQKRIVGIKIYTGYQQIDLHDQKLRRVAAVATKHDLPMMFHCGYSHKAMQDNGKIAYADVVKASDLEHVVKDWGARVIVAHLAKPNIDDTMSTIKRTPGMYADMSGLFLSRSEHEDIPGAVEDIRRFVNECGSKRLLFGTDYPLQTHDDSIYLIEQAMKMNSADEKRDVYFQNTFDLVFARDADAMDDALESGHDIHCTRKGRWRL